VILHTSCSRQFTWDTLPLSLCRSPDSRGEVLVIFQSAAALMGFLSRRLKCAVMWSSHYSCGKTLGNDTFITSRCQILQFCNTNKSKKNNGNWWDCRTEDPALVKCPCVCQPGCQLDRKCNMATFRPIHVYKCCSMCFFRRHIASCGVLFEGLDFLYLYVSTGAWFTKFELIFLKWSLRRFTDKTNCTGWAGSGFVVHSKRHVKTSGSSSMSLVQEHLLP